MWVKPHLVLPGVLPAHLFVHSRRGPTAGPRRASGRVDKRSDGHERDIWHGQPRGCSPSFARYPKWQCEIRILWTYLWIYSHFAIRLWWLQSLVGFHLWRFSCEYSSFEYLLVSSFCNIRFRRVTLATLSSPYHHFSNISAEIFIWGTYLPAF